MWVGLLSLNYQSIGDMEASTKQNPAQFTKMSRSKEEAMQRAAPVIAADVMVQVWERNDDGRTAFNHDESLTLLICQTIKWSSDMNANIQNQNSSMYFGIFLACCFPSGDDCVVLHPILQATLCPINASELWHIFY